MAVDHKFEIHVLCWRLVNGRFAVFEEYLILRSHKGGLGREWLTPSRRFWAKSINSAYRMFPGGMRGIFRRILPKIIVIQQISYN